ncbi:MAG: uracil-DNA glycosylase [Cyanobacteriota bacterium]
MNDTEQLGIFVTQKKPQLPKVEPPLLPETSFLSLEDAKEAAMNCKKCILAQSRTKVVFSQGNPEAKVMLIGEGPGQHEDESGIPFVGRAGQLLDKIFESVDIVRERDVYICNIVKCRPPKNRVPAPEEMDCCYDYLAAQIRYVNPKIILLAGSTAVKGILKTKQGITKIRGTWYENVFGAKAMPIFHPSYLLRNQSKQVGSPKWLMWQDIQEIKRQMDLIENC